MGEFRESRGVEVGKSGELMAMVSQDVVALHEILVHKRVRDRQAPVEIVVRKGAEVVDGDGGGKEAEARSPYIEANPLFAGMEQGEVVAALDGEERVTILPDADRTFGRWNEGLWSIDQGSLPEAAPEEKKRTPDQEALLALARRVAPAVVTLRVWDEFGVELASGSGFFVSEGGMVLTDVEVIHPEISGRIDFITATTGLGEHHLVTGVWQRDVTSGVALLQTDARGVPTVEMDSEATFDERQAVTVLAVHRTRGLILADAEIWRDETTSGEGWLNLSGEDSPGAVGSPVISREGKVVAMVSMKVPLDRWMNFAVPVSLALDGFNELPEDAMVLSDLSSGSLTLRVFSDERFKAAYAHLEAKRWRAGASQLLRLTKIYPRSAECWALLGIASKELGATDDALQCQRRAVALNPSLDESWYQLGVNGLAQTGSEDGEVMIDVSREALEKASMERPGDGRVWLMLGQVYLSEKRHDDAVNVLKQAVKINSRDAAAFFYLGYAYSRMGDYEAAKTAVARSLRIEPRQAQGWFFLGLMETARGNHGEAVVAFKNVIEVEPEHPHAWQNLAHAHLAEGRRTEGRQAWRRHQELVAAREAVAGSLVEARDRDG
ncbi:MAG: tetratricopeptide repeat protein [Verrucomicrobiota bacterium]